MLGAILIPIKSHMSMHGSGKLGWCHPAVLGVLTIKCCHLKALKFHKNNIQLVGSVLYEKLSIPFCLISPTQISCYNSGIQFYIMIALEV